MNREEKLDSLKLYLESIDRLPEDAMRQGVSLYELRTIIQIVYELLEEK